jgi:6-phosphogluconolactonase
MPDSSPELHVLAAPGHAVAEILAAQAGRGGSIVLTGGSSVADAYREAAALEPDWSAATVWWGDERCVPPEDERSNFRLAKENLLDHLQQQPREIHRIRGELPPAEAADELDQALVGVQFDLMLLGLGPDGHMASLFPASPQLGVRDRRAAYGPAGLEPWVDRVTMTLPTINAAARLVFLVTGADKADAVSRAFAGEITAEVPGSLARLAPVPVEVFLDEASAVTLEP